LSVAAVYKIYGGLIVEERYAPPGFRARLGYKDMRFALGTEALEVPLPVASLLHNRFLALLALGLGRSRLGRSAPRADTPWRL
jgi:3-hydroxyisobutyrate dehydrogenase-like beta-hydroxyacid dehydrogenase